jgi:hypothetical protein
MYHAMKTVKQRRQINARQKMIDGVKKMEADIRDGMAYSSAICLEDEDEDERNCEEPAKKKKKTINSNKRTSSRKKEEGCKCGGRDHQRISAMEGAFNRWLQKIMRGECKKCKRCE